MSETILIHYSPNQILSYVILNEKGAISSPAQQVDVEELTTLAKTRKVQVLFDAAFVNIDAVKIPGNNRQRQLQAVPFALEDKLASDIDDLHFALGKKQADEKIPVITIADEYMQQCIAFFNAVEVSPERIYVDVLSLPLENNSWTILVSEYKSLVKIDDFSGFYCDTENLHAVLKSAIKSTESNIEKLILIHKADDSIMADQFDDLELEIIERQYNEFPLETLVPKFNESKQINLLQARYKPQRKGTQVWKNWKSVAAIIGVFMVLQLISASIETQQLKTKNQRLTAQIEKTFKKANPGARKFNNMRKRLERRIKDLQTGKADGANEVFLDILKDTAPALSRQKKIDITALVYRNKRIDIELSADSLQTLETIKSQLSQLHKIKTVLSTSVEKNKVSGRLRLEKQG